MKLMIDNKDGLGLVAMLHAQMLTEQVEYVVGLEERSIKDLPPRTEEQERAFSWDEGLMR